MSPDPQFRLRASCRHPSGRFVEFRAEDIEQSLPARFEQQVDAHADRVAVQTPSEAWTYRDLDRAANRVAGEIVARLGKGGEPVGVLFEHGAEGVAAILGVLKTGRAYVALDPVSPRARTAFLLADSGARLIATHGRCRALAEDLAQGGVAVVDVGALAASPAARLGLPISADAAASIYYTSGSTGRPKGVTEIHRHRLVNARRTINALRVTPDDRLVLLYGIGFSGSVNDVFGALLAGARLCPFDLRASGAAALGQWLREQEVTIYHSTPTVFRSLLDALGPGEGIPSLRVVSLASDAVYALDVERFRRHFAPPCLLLNAWGATESPFFRPYAFAARGEPVAGPVPAIGLPEEEDEIRLVDDGGRPVAAGEPGEIVVVSRYLSPGYWGRADLTRERFRSADDLGGAVGERAYFTGDVGRMLVDGSIAHLGRKDFQVKVRGYRVEPAEVEGALRALSGVEHAAVMGRSDGQGGHRLVAYVVVSDAAATAPALRQALRERMPDYLVPTRFVFLPALPLTPNGKLDRLSLPEPGRGRPALDHAMRAPGTPLERALAAIWADVLEIDDIGVDDDFLELGGDSLRAMQLVSRVRQLSGVDVPVDALFDAPTVALMALAVAGHRPAPDGARAREASAG